VAWHEANSPKPSPYSDLGAGCIVVFGASQRGDELGLALPTRAQSEVQAELKELVNIVDPLVAEK
jgi:hypothetical protein